MTHKIVGIGELLWDNLPSGRQLGGAPTNVAYHTTALGAQGFIVSCVGADANGKDAIEALDKLGVNREYVATHTNAPTGEALIKVDRSGIPAFTITENAAWDAIQLTPELLELSQQADAIVFGTLAQRSEISRTTIRTFINESRGDALRILDLNLRPPYYSDEVLQWSLNSCNVLKLNENELQIISNLADIEKAKHQVLDQIMDMFSIDLIALTFGEEGSLLYSKKERCDCNGYVTSIVDTVGAGDAFTAALTLGILKKLDFGTISDYANRVASFVCSKAGATPPIPAKLRISEYLATKPKPHV